MTEPVVLWAAVSGFLSSMFVLPLIQQPHWSDLVRSAVTFGWCVVVGLGNVYFNGQWNPSDIAASVLLVVFSAVTAYRTLKPIPKSIEAATSPRRRKKPTPDVPTPTPTPA